MATNKKASPKAKGKSANVNNDEWEQLSGGAFPPIWKPQEQGDEVCFIPIKVEEGPNGYLLRGTMVASNGGDFVQQQKSVSVPKGEQFQVGLSTSLAGEGKLVGIDKKGKVTGEETDILTYSIKNGSPIRLQYDGKQKSKKRKGKFFHTFTIMVPKSTRQAVA